MISESHNPKVYTVDELTREIQDILDDRFDFIWVEGEISNFSTPVSGHYYMVLKDEKAKIRAVMFRLKARHLRFRPENGMKVIAQGRIGVYAPRGEYQIILDYLEPLGLGALALAFEQLKKKLAALGVFDEDGKKPLPFLPQKVAVITSPTGAAVRDFLKVILRRFANIEIIIVPVRVQGDGATMDMVNALDLINRELSVDVIVLTRGGGSLEDLWAFNEEELALAIRRSRIPVVSAVGHEIDLTISDLAADFRAPTPSASAEILVREKESLVGRLDEMKNRMASGMLVHLDKMRQGLDRLSKSLKDPRKRLEDSWLRLDEIHSRLTRVMDLIIRHGKERVGAERRALLLNSPVQLINSRRQQLDFQRISLCRAMTGHIGDKRMEFSLHAKRLKDLNPMSILERGYSITLKLPEKTALRETSDVEMGARVQVRLAKGQLICRVEETD